MTELLQRFNACRERVGSAELARGLGVTTSAIRMIGTGHYPPKAAARILAKFRDKYLDTVPCPHTGQDLPIKECRLRAASPRPLSGHERLAWWQACRSCAHNTHATGEST